VVNIPQGNISLIKNYTRNVGEFIIRLPFDTNTPIAPIIDLVQEVVDDIDTKDHVLLYKYGSKDDVRSITTIFDIVVRGVSDVNDGRITVQIKGEATPGEQFGAKRALLKVIAGYLEDNNVQFYSTHIPEGLR